MLPLSAFHISVATSHYHLHFEYTSLNWFDMQGPALHTISFWVGVDYWQTSWCYRDFYSLVWYQRIASSMDVIIIWFIITYFHRVICCLTFFIPIGRPYFAHWLWQWITSHSWSWNWAHGGCDGSTRDAYSPRRLIQPLVFPGFRVSPIFTVLWIVPFTWSGNLFQLQISYVYFIWRTDFDCGFLRLPDVDTLILTNGFYFWNGAHGVCDRSTGDAYSS
jgi:hypothetical protein